jgi:hypothetical protein
MGAANGAMYVASFSNLVVQNVTQDLLQLYTNDVGTQAVIIHSWRLTCFPLQKSGVAQDDRMTLQIVRRSAPSGPGVGQNQIPITGLPLNPLNDNSLTNVSTNLYSVGTLSQVLDTFSVSVMYPWSIVYREDQRLPLRTSVYPTDYPVCLYMAVPPSTWYLMEGEVVYEESGE